MIEATAGERRLASSGIRVGTPTHTQYLFIQLICSHRQAIYFSISDNCIKHSHRLNHNIVFINLFIGVYMRVTKIVKMFKDNHKKSLETLHNNKILLIK